MNHKTTTHNFRPASLRGTGSARTVLLRMAADQERADRIRALKQDRPDLTWRRIADHVGVSERAATDWQKKGGIEYDNAKKLAAIFKVDVDYIWRGDPQQAPDMFPPADADERMATMEARLMEQAEIIRGLLEQQNGLLARQSSILERIERVQAGEEAAVGRLESATQRADEVVHRLDAASERVGSVLRGGTPRRGPAAKKPASKRSPRASKPKPD